MDNLTKRHKRSFEEDCKVIVLKDEYYGFVGREKFAIITRLSAHQLFGMYQDEFKVLRPFVIMTPEMGEIVREYKKADECYKKRYSRGSEFLISCLESEENLISGLQVEDSQTIKEQKEYEQSRVTSIRIGIHSGLDTLTELQKKYLLEYCLENKPLKQIAKEEGKSIATINISISNAKKKIEAVFADMGVM